MTSTTNAHAIRIGTFRSTVVNPEPVYLDPSTGEVDWYLLDHLAQAESSKPELITRFGQPTHCSITEPGWVAVNKGSVLLFIQGQPSLPNDDLTTYVDQMLDRIRAHDTMAKPVPPDDQKLSATAAPYAALYGYQDIEQRVPAATNVEPRLFYEATTSFIADLAHSTSIEDFISIHALPPQSVEQSNPAEIRDNQHPLLLESVEELKEAAEYAADEGWPLPTADSLARTESLLRRMFDAQPHRYWVYPTPEGELVIDGGYQDHRIIVTLSKEGGAIYTYTDPANGHISAVECPDPQNPARPPNGSRSSAGWEEAMAWHEPPMSAELSMS